MQKETSLKSQKETQQPNQKPEPKYALEEKYKEQTQKIHTRLSSVPMDYCGDGQKVKEELDENCVPIILITDPFKESDHSELHKELLTIESVKNIRSIRIESN